jgi:phosphoribosylanthranilate isomerase
MPKIKICGLSREADIDYANEAAPDYIGFVFAPSKRQVSAARAERLRARLMGGIAPVGVFVDAPVGDIAALHRAGIIAVAQLHGGEDEAYIERLKELCAVPVIKAVKLGEAAGRDEAARLAQGGATRADFLLFDSGAGSGAPFDRSALPSLLSGKSPPVFIAGGINVSTIEEIVKYQPFGVDVSSGAETGGVKDRGKMLRLVKAARLSPRA